MANFKSTDINALEEEIRVMIEAAENEGWRYKIKSSGVGGEYSEFRIKPSFTDRGDRHVIQNPDSAAAIILDNNPEYADSGRDFCSRISIVAGVKGHELRPRIDKDGKLIAGSGPEVDDLEPIRDAAGIYVRQVGYPQNALNSIVNEQRNKDNNLPLVSPIGDHKKDPKGVQYKAYSDVTAFADTIQLVARSGGVNIYTGGVADKLAIGLKNQTSIGTHLIHGNRIVDWKKRGIPKKDRPYTMQPMVKGYELDMHLDEINASIAEVRTLVLQIYTNLANLKTVVGAHAHPAAMAYTLPSPELMLAAGFSLFADIYTFLGKITAKYNAVAEKINKSQATPNSLLSSWHKLN